VSKIIRDPAQAAQTSYDLIIIGGGIYGAMLALEATQRGLRSLLLERDDFGGATSLNSLRIIHGGFRYLQTLDLRRYTESVRERQWFLQTFPDLIKPLPCLMPLYGKGLRRPLILSAALRINDLLSWQRNQQVPSTNHLPDGKIISAAEVEQRFPLVNPAGLQGGAIWYDACMPDSQRVLITVLRCSCALGGTALNYVEAKELMKAGDRVTGVIATDNQTGESYPYHAPVVINAAGPWCRELAARFDRDFPELFRPSLAWNILFDRPALSDHALAISSPTAEATTYFFHPWKSKLLIGTVHQPWQRPISAHPTPEVSDLMPLLQDLNQAIPGLNLVPPQILRIFSGFLPVLQEGTAQLSTRAQIKHHQTSQMRGLYSISGVKFTTARWVAEQTITTAFPEHRYQQKQPIHEIQRTCQNEILQSLSRMEEIDECYLDSLRNLVVSESVQSLDDLILRRTCVGDNPEQSLQWLSAICQRLTWQEQQSTPDLARLHQTLQGYRSSPLP
jgi:glycerol-3-phosphate dehydrogenase